MLGNVSFIIFRRMELILLSVSAVLSIIFFTFLQDNILFISLTIILICYYLYLITLDLYNYITKQHVTQLSFYVNNITITIIMTIINLYLKTHHYTVEVSKSIKNLEDIFQLRYKIYKKIKFIETNENQIFYDNYDLFSQSFYVQYKDSIISSVRVTFNNSGIGFTTTNYFNVDLSGYDTSKMVCIGRWIKDKNIVLNSKTQHLLDIQLFYQVLKVLYKNNIRYIIFDSPGKLINHIEYKFNIKTHKLTELELSEKHKYSRMNIQGYFDQYILEPRIVDLNDIKLNKIISNVIFSR